MSFQRTANWIVGLPIAVAVAVFAIANRQWITVSLDPFSADAPRLALAMPQWALFFCGIFVGLLAGWIAAWFAHGKWRKAARQARIELLRAEGELARQRREEPSRDVVPAAGP